MTGVSFLFQKKVPCTKKLKNYQVLPIDILALLINKD